MEEVTIIGIDLAKRSFQVHGAGADGLYKYSIHLTPGLAEVRASGCPSSLPFRLASCGSRASRSPS